jgi:hypothetical protein
MLRALTLMVNVADLHGEFGLFGTSSKLSAVRRPMRWSGKIVEIKRRSQFAGRRVRRRRGEST